VNTSGLRWLRSLIFASAALAVPFWVLCGVVAADLRCGERCDSGPWHSSGQGWQWEGQLVIVGIGALLLIGAAVLAGRRRTGAATWAVLASLTLFAAWYLLVGRHVSLG
jgi:hypothetical protein